MPATFVYVSNAEDGDIGTYRLLDSGELRPGPRVKAAATVMPMAVSPDKRFLLAAARSKPYTVYAYAVDPVSGALTRHATAPLAESFPYISFDRTGRYLLGASYGGNVVSVNGVGSDGRVTEPLQVIPVGRHPHSIRVDESNRYAYAPTLGSDEIFQFRFDAATGKLTSNTPAVFLMKPMTGPRHFLTSSDGHFIYMLSEFLATVTTFAIDGATGLLSEVASVSGLAPDTRLTPGASRTPTGAFHAPAPRGTGNDAWAGDIHMTPDERFLYISERTDSTLSTLAVDRATGKLTYLSSVPTEKQPRGFAIDPTGRFLIASGEKSDMISVHAIDAASGALELLGRHPAGRGSNWVEIVAVH